MKKIEVIAGDAIVTLPMSGGFYQRVQQTLNVLIQSKTEEELKVHYQNIKDKKSLNEYEQALETMFIFCATFEKLAKEQGVITEKEVEELN